MKHGVGSTLANPLGMLVDMKLFAVLAVLVAIVGSYLWLRSASRSSSRKLSGIGDQGQYGGGKKAS